MLRRARSSKARRYVIGALVGVWGAWGIPVVRADGLPGNWVEVRTPHFVVVSNAGRHSAHDTAEHFEQIRQLFSQALPGRIAESGPPLTVFAVGSERTLKRLLPEYWERRGGTRPVGVFRSTQTGTQVAVRADLLGNEDYGIVYHEYFHFLAHGTGVKMPVWLNEGLASYWGSTRLTSKASEVGRPDISRLDRLRTGHFLPLEELMAVDRSSPHYSRSDEAQLFYAQSWALTHYLMVGDLSGKGRDQLIDYLNRIAAGESTQEAGTRAFGDLKDLESRLRIYTRKLRFPYFEMAPPAPLSAEQVQIRELSRAAVTAMVALFRLESRQTKDVEEWVAFALEGAPDRVETQVAAGLLHTWNREFEQAEQAFQRAVRLEGASALAHYGLAVLRFYRDLAPESLGDIAQHLEHARAIDPGFAPAEARLAELYRRTEGCSPQALTHIRDARAIDPRYLLYPLKEAEILMRCGEEDEARSIVRQVVREAEDSQSASVNNQVCWSGSLWGFARQVLSVCDLAVEMNPESYSILDSRGVARAISGDMEGAAADLRTALQLAGQGWREEPKTQREAWIRGLESGENPFAGEGLATFREDPASMGLEWGL